MGILIACSLALIFSLMLSRGYKEMAFTPLLAFFIILFLAALAGKYWVVSFNPALWGIVFPMVIFSFVCLSLLIASGPGIMIRRDIKEDEAVFAMGTISGFIWIVLFVLLLAFVAGYYRIF